MTVLRTCALTLRDEHRFRGSEKRMLRRMFDLMERKWRGDGENYITWSFIACTLHRYY
jgi:hypothetical protein